MACIATQRGTHLPKYTLSPSIPSDGLNSTFAGLATHPFNPFDEFKGEFRVIAADLRNAKGGQSTRRLEIDRPWDAFTDDHIGLMDHLGIGQFMVLGFCIGGPFIWNLLQRAGDRVVACRHSPAATVWRCPIFPTTTT